MTQRGLGAAALVLCCTWALGCASTARPLASDSVSYNREFGAAQNELMLLNVVRASHRHPLFFTGVGEISQTREWSLGIGPDAPFGGDADSAFDLGAEVGASGGPTVSMGVRDGQAFMRGITSPVAIETLRYLVDQGWPMELVLRLLVREVRDQDGTRIVRGQFYVDPATGRTVVGQDYQDYVRVIRGLAESGRFTTQPPTWTAFGPTLTAETIRENPDWLATAQQGGYKLEHTASRTVSRPDGSLEAVPEFWQVLKKTEGEVVLVSGSVSYRDQSAGEEAGGKELVIRSPEALIYHLGEITRLVDDAGGHVPQELRIYDDRPQPLWAASRAGSQGGRPVVSVQYEGCTWSIPCASAGGESMHVLSLLSQLLALHHEAKDLPTTTSVKVVGGRLR